MRARGSGILRTHAPHARQARATVLRGDVRSRARELRAAGHHQGQLHRDRASRRVSRLRRRQDLRCARPGHWRAPLPGPVDLDRVQQQPARHPGAAPQGRARHRALRAGSGRATTARRCSTCSRPIRATSCSRPASQDLIRIVRGVVNLYERRTVRLLARRDPYHRFYSCLVYVPRDRYNTEVRQRIEQIVARGLRRHAASRSQVQISGSNHARVHVVVRTDPDDARKVDLAAHRAAHRRRRRRPGPIACAGADRRAAARPRGLALAARYRARLPAGLPGGRRPRATRSRTSPISKRLRAHAAGAAAATCIGPRQQRRDARAPEDRQARRAGADLRPAADAGELRAARHLRASLRARLARRRRRLDPGLRARASRPHARSTSRGVEIDVPRSLRRRLARRSRERRLQPPAARRRTRARARSSCCAPTAATCCRPACRSARRTWSARWPRNRRHRAQPGAAVRDALRPVRRPAARRRRATPTSSSRRSARGLDAVTSLDEDRILRAYLNAGRRRRCAPTSISSAPTASRRAICPFKLDPAQDPRPAAAAAEVRDLRLQPARRSACICAWATWRAAASAGPTGARTSAPRSWA